MSTDSRNGSGTYQRMKEEPEAARKEFERILQQAHTINKVMAGYVVQALTQTDPVKSAQALDSAIATTETLAMEFRRARSHLGMASPGLSLPSFPPLRPRTGLSRPPPPRAF